MKRESITFNHCLKKEYPMANIYQIGSGMVGSVMALDLAKDHSVFLADNDEKT